MGGLITNFIFVFLKMYLDFILKDIFISLRKAFWIGNFFLSFFFLFVFAALENSLYCLWLPYFLLRMLRGFWLFCLFFFFFFPSLSLLLRFLTSSQQFFYDVSFGINFFVFMLFGFRDILKS